MATVKEITEMIRRFYVKMGASAFLSDEMILMLIGELKENFGGWKISEIENAFNLGLNGRLSIEMNLYNKPFNLVFLANLMNAYRDFIRPALDREKKLMVPEKAEPTKEEKKRIAIEAVVIEFNNFLKTGDVLNFGNSIFNVMRVFIDYPDELFQERAKKLMAFEIEKRKAKEGNKKPLKEVLLKLKSDEIDEDIEFKLKRIISTLKLRAFFEALQAKRIEPKYLIDRWIHFRGNLEQITAKDMAKILMLIR
jgi:hypothetical protein